MRAEASTLLCPYVPNTCSLNAEWGDSIEDLGMGISHMARTERVEVRMQETTADAFIDTFSLTVLPAKKTSCCSTGVPFTVEMAAVKTAIRELARFTSSLSPSPLLWISAHSYKISSP